MSKIVRLMLCLMLVFISSLAVNPQTSFAKPKEEKQAKKEEVVYATKRGKKYHNEGCRFINNKETIQMSKEEAETKGLKPCGRCFTEETQDEE